MAEHVMNDDDNDVWQQRYGGVALNTHCPSIKCWCTHMIALEMKVIMMMNDDDIEG